MATRLTYDLTYDAPLTDVGEMLMDPAFREQVCDAQGALRKTVTVGQDGGGMKVVIDMVQAAAGHPGLRQEVRRRRDPAGADRALVRHRERPGRGRHPRQARPDERHDRRSASPAAPRPRPWTMEIQVSIPLVGGKIESLIADLLRKALKAENAVGRQYLAS